MLNFRGVQPPNLPMAMVSQLWLRLYWAIYGTFFFPKDAKEDYQKTIAALDTPNKVGAWLVYNVKYTPDRYSIDSWQPAERTFIRKKGDCEDWAIFANECLRNKYECYFICMYTETTGHAELLIKTNTNTYISVGTYGINQHHGVWDDLPPDWSGFQNYIVVEILDEDLNTIYQHQR